MEDPYDVVIVGAGIGGSALAATLAAAGQTVLVLEQQVTYKDKVRGETIMPWGVREVMRLGLEDVLLSAGGDYASAFMRYDEVLPREEWSPFPLSMVAPDVKGTLNVGHPEACHALSEHASAAGAVIARGARDVKVARGTTRSVSWVGDDGLQEASSRFVVGADGRGSAVRRQSGIDIEERNAVVYGAGLLVEADAGLEGRNVLGTEGDALYLAFPRQSQLTRLYLMVDIAQQRDFTGAGRAETFLERFRAESFPESTALAAGRAAGPCGGAPMTDSWTTTPPVTNGMVLIGDAAGWNDPIIGQGLSIALRDARMVGDVLTASDDWSPAAFDGYVEEREERMRRLAAAARLTTEMRARFTEEARERRGRWMAKLATDTTLLLQIGAPLMGPENVPADVLSDEALEATFAL